MKAEPSLFSVCSYLHGAKLHIFSLPTTEKEIFFNKIEEKSDFNLICPKNLGINVPYQSYRQHTAHAYVHT